jgi:hypothetical protein
LIAKLIALDLPDLKIPVADIGRSVVSAMIWIPYLLKSKRVRLTFVR